MVAPFFPIYDHMPGPGGIPVRHALQSYEEERLHARNSTTRSSRRTRSPTSASLTPTIRPSKVSKFSDGDTEPTEGEVKDFLGMDSTDAPFATLAAMKLLGQKDRLLSKFAEVVPAASARKNSPWDWKGVPPFARRDRSDLQIPTAEKAFYDAPGRELVFEPVGDESLRIRYQGQTRTSAIDVRLPKWKLPRVSVPRFQLYKKLCEESFTAAVTHDHPAQSLSVLHRFCVEDAFYKLQRTPPTCAEEQDPVHQVIQFVPHVSPWSPGAYRVTWRQADTGDPFVFTIPVDGLMDSYEPRELPAYSPLDFETVGCNEMDKAFRTAKSWAVELFAFRSDTCGCQQKYLQLASAATSRAGWQEQNLRGVRGLCTIVIDRSGLNPKRYFSVSRVFLSTEVNQVDKPVELKYITIPPNVPDAMNKFICDRVDSFYWKYNDIWASLRKLMQILAGLEGEGLDDRAQEEITTPPSPDGAPCQHLDKDSDQARHYLSCCYPVGKRCKDIPDASSEKCIACIRAELENKDGFAKLSKALSSRAWNLSRTASYRDRQRTGQCEPPISLYNGLLRQVNPSGKSYSFGGETFPLDKTASIDATDLVTVTPLGKRHLHSRENVKITPLAYNLSKWIHPESVHLQMAKCVSLTTAPEGNGGLFGLADMEKRDRSRDNRVEIDRRLVEVLATVDESLFIPYFVRDRLDPLKVSDTQIRRFYKRDSERQRSAVATVTPAALYPTTAAQARNPARGRASARPVQLTRGEQDRLLLDQKIVEAFEGAGDYKLPRAEDGTPLPFTHPAERSAWNFLTVRHRFRILATRLAFWCDRHFETERQMNSTTLYLSICQSVVEQQGRDPVTGGLFTSRPRDPTRLSIGSHRTNQPMKSGWKTANPVDITTFCREERTILAHHWWTNLLYWCFNDEDSRKHVQGMSRLGSTVE